MEEALRYRPDEERLNVLVEVKEHGNLDDLSASRWELVTITVDSGASETVAPFSMARHIPVTDSAASLRGVVYEVANGARIHNKGEKKCLMQSTNGTERLLSFQVCDVHKPLLAVSRLCEAGYAVVFHPAWSYIEDIETGEKMTLEQNEGLYQLKAWIKAAPEPASDAGFARQGARS